MNEKQPKRKKHNQKKTNKTRKIAPPSHSHHKKFHAVSLIAQTIYIQLLMKLATKKRKQNETFCKVCRICPQTATPLLL